MSAPDHTVSPVVSKICLCCHRLLALDSFGRHKGRKDGLQSICRSCKTEADRRYREQYPDRTRQRKRRYYVEHQEEIKDKAKTYRRQHRSQMTRYKRLWKAKNPDKVREHNRIYHQRHPEDRAISEARRRARKLASSGQYTRKDVKAQYERQKGNCYYCHKKAQRNGKPYHVDHVVPLDRGGSNGPENIVIACAYCNQHKSDRLPHEWPEGGRLL